MGIPRRSARLIGGLLIAALWFSVGALLFAVLMEHSGGVTAYERWRTGAEPGAGVGRERLPPAPRYEALDAVYVPFTIQRLHPFYLFSLPLSRQERSALSNDVVRFSPEGFRGPGPAERGSKKLAFLLGASTTFGHYATSDETTITGYLNARQTVYHFVNAGVPSWNSQQELHQLVDEISSYRPELVVTFSGSNDPVVAFDYALQGHSFPPGTPESFDALLERIDDLRGSTPQRAISIYDRLFPRLTHLVRRELGMLQEPTRFPQHDDDIAQLAQATADRYVQNVRMMQIAANGIGARFVGILQPISYLHHNIDRALADDGVSGERLTMHRLFREAVVANARDVCLVDFSRIFDTRFATVPIFDRGRGDLAPERDVFVDRAHLTDKGNAVIAELISDILQGSVRPESGPVACPVVTGAIER